MVGAPHGSSRPSVRKALIWLLLVSVAGTVSVWQALQRGIDRGELRRDADFNFIYDLLMGPLFMRSVVRGEELGPELAEALVDLVMRTFEPRGKTKSPPSGRRPQKRRAT